MEVLEGYISKKRVLAAVVLEGLLFLGVWTGSMSPSRDPSLIQGGGQMGSGSSRSEVISSPASVPPEAGISESSTPAVSAPEPPASEVPPASQPEVIPQVTVADPRIPPEPVENYAWWLVEQIAAEITTPGMSEYDKAKAAHDYMVENVSKGEAVCPELWRIYQKDPDTPLTFLENRAISPLRFEIGMCEDQAAALVLLLRGMGLEAEYIPGFIFSVQGDAMDHAWLMVQVDGSWYHMDPDMESYRARRGRIIYQYFLKGDAEMHRHHRWGENAIAAGYLSAEKNEELRQYAGHPCPADYSPAPEPKRMNGRAQPEASVAMQMAARAEEQAKAEIAAYEAEHGPLAPIRLNMEPPVFGYEGYGPEIW